MMKLLMILTGVLFLIGCSNGGLELSSERKPQTSLDLDLLTADDLGSSEKLLASVDLDSVEGEADLPAPKVVVRTDSQRHREFGKRRKRDSDLAVTPGVDERPEIAQSDSLKPREFGKRRRDSDLVVTPRSDERGDVVQNTSQKPRDFGKRRWDSDLVVTPPGSDERGNVVQNTSQKPRNFGKRRNKDSDLLTAEKETRNKGPVSVVTDINNKVDILIVADGTFSTKHILRDIPEKMDGFIPALDTFLDWRVAFIGADVKRGKDKKLSSMEIDGAIVLERKYITKRTHSKERIFIDTLTRNKNRRRCAFPPQCGSLKETPLLALTEYVLSPSRSVETGTRFIRDEAHLAIVILTDNKENKKKGHVTTADEVLGSIEQEFGSDKEVSVHTLTVLNEDCRDQLKQDHFFVEGTRAGEILLLATETGGENLSLCADDYATPLAESIEKSVLGSEEMDCSACSNVSAISDRERTV